MRGGVGAGVLGGGVRGRYSLTQHSVLSKQVQRFEGGYDDITLLMEPQEDRQKSYGTQVGQKHGVPFGKGASTCDSTPNSTLPAK